MGNGPDHLKKVHDAVWLRGWDSGDGHIKASALPMAKSPLPAGPLGAGMLFCMEEGYDEGQLGQQHPAACGGASGGRSGEGTVCLSRRKREP